MTFINHIYNQLKDNNVVQSADQFSVDYLKRSPSYYRTLKAQNKEACDEVLQNILSCLTTRASITKGYQNFANEHSKRVIHEWVGRIEGIADEVADEIVLRTTQRGDMDTNAINSVFLALQRALSNKSKQTTQTYH